MDPAPPGVRPGTSGKMSKSNGPKKLPSKYGDPPPGTNRASAASTAGPTIGLNWTVASSMLVAKVASRGRLIAIGVMNEEPDSTTDGRLESDAGAVATAYQTAIRA